MKKKLIIIIACAVAGIAGMVVLLCCLLSGGVNYAGAKDEVQKIAGTKAAVSEFLDANDEQGKSESFEAAIKTADETFAKLKEASATKDGRVKELLEQAEGEHEKLAKFSRIWEDLKLKSSESEYLKSLAGEIAELREGQQEFEEKYGKDKQQSLELIKDYGALWQKSTVLEEKAKDVSLTDIFGMSRDDIMSFYATIEELEKYLETK